MPLPPNVPTAVVTLDRPRTIAFHHPAIVRLMKATGRSFGDLVIDDADRLIEDLDKWLWAGLVDEDREDFGGAADVAVMIHLGNMTSIMETILSLMVDSFPQLKGAEGNVVPAPPQVRAGKKARRG